MRFLSVLLFCLSVLSAPGAEAAERLKDASSPYLRMHAPDLVDWHPWGEEALAEAKRTGRPILLSVGYSACHWCHVMQRESYQDAETAALINARFVPVLIDREERPDLDAVFQTAAQAMGWRSGWPLTLFLTPDGTPFFGGAYFPKEAMASTPAFSDVLTTLSTAWTEKREAVARGAAGVMIAMLQLSAAAAGEVSAATLDTGAADALGEIDKELGGFRSDGPKFPEATSQKLLWRAWLRTGEDAYRDAVMGSLRAMVRGSLQDHLGGGFFRYTVEPHWRIPHFEKMLNVNAALLELLTEAWRETRDSEFAGAARDTVDFLLREMRLPDGAFAAALDADSIADIDEEAEGAFYVWDASDIEAALGDGAEAFFQTFALAVTGEGSVLFRKREGKMPGAARDILMKLRDERVRPFRDDKVLVDWNALTIIALAEAGLAFDEPAWTEAARAAFAAIAQRFDADPRHSWFGEQAGPVALLRDLAGLSSAALTLFEATGEETYLDQARRWMAWTEEHHFDAEGGGFFASREGSGPVVVRAKPFLDDPDASGNGVAAEVLARLGHLTGDGALRKQALDTLTAFGRWSDGGGRGVAGLLNALDTLEAGLQIVLVGERGTHDTDRLLRIVFETSLPTRTLLVIPPGTSLPEDHPAWNKGQEDGHATTYVCRGTVCSLPVTEVRDLAEVLREMRAKP